MKMFLKIVVFDNKIKWMNFICLFLCGWKEGRNMRTRNKTLFPSILFTKWPFPILTTFHPFCHHCPYLSRSQLTGQIDKIKDAAFGGKEKRKRMKCKLGPFWTLKRMCFFGKTKNKIRQLLWSGHLWQKETDRIILENL